MKYAWIVSGCDADYNSVSFPIGVFSDLNMANNWLKVSGTDKKFYPQCLSAAKYVVDIGTVIKTVRGYPFQEV